MASVLKVMKRVTSASTPRGQSSTRDTIMHVTSVVAWQRRLVIWYSVLVVSKAMLLLRRSDGCMRHPAAVTLVGVSDIVVAAVLPSGR